VERDYSSLGRKGPGSEGDCSFSRIVTLLIHAVDTWALSSPHILYL
jgi:hypothetical protein